MPNSWRKDCWVYNLCMPEQGGPDNSGEIKSRDLDLEARRIARQALAIAVLGATLGGMGLGVCGYVLYESSQRPAVTQRVNPEIAKELQALREIVETERLASCLNESQLRRLANFPPLGSLEECQQEHQVWKDKYDAQPTPAPTSLKQG